VFNSINLIFVIYLSEIYKKRNQPISSRLRSIMLPWKDSELYTAVNEFEYDCQ